MKFNKIPTFIFHHCIMAELDWDLWAVVRSCNSPAAAATEPITVPEEPLTLSPSPVFKQNENPSGRRSYNGFEELHEVYETFIANSQSNTSFVSQCDGFTHQLEQPPPSPIPQPQRAEPIGDPIEQCGQERKRSHRTSVVEVEAENLVEVDPWSWRKYGRKPIKTSPFPRNYYKCSSDGNKCPAKKYVEKSKIDPEKVIVSYSGEHNHSPPRKLIRTP